MSLSTDTEPSTRDATWSQALWTRRNTPAVLAVSAAAGGLLALLVPAEATLPVLLGVLALAAAFDLRTGLIPNSLTLGATVFALAAWLTSSPVTVTPLIAAVTAAATLALLRAASTAWLGVPGFGLGDVKLAVPMGLVLGWPVLWALYLAVVLAALVAVVGLFSGRLTRRSRIPFAPFILGGTLLHLVLAARHVLDWIATVTL